MGIFFHKKNIKRKIIVELIIPITFLVGILFSINAFYHLSNLNTQKNSYNDFTNLKLSNSDSILFEGIEESINITDYGTLYNLSQEISLDNQNVVNLTYYLDDNHDWKASKIENSISNIQDTRNWVNNSGFSSPTIFRVYTTGVETDHNYSQPHNPSSITDTIVETHNPTYMRTHFSEIGFERYYDYLYLLDSDDNYHLITDTESRYNVYSPWIPGDTIQLTYRADNQDPYYGYHVDYYEYVNDSSNYDINSETWGFNYVENGASETNIYGSGECGNATAMYVGLYGTYIDYYDFDYIKGAFSELYQNISIPRGSVINAYISFDYNVPFGLESNDNYIYFKINNNKVYSKGMGDIVEAGKNIWHSTGKIYMDLWTNTTSIFEDILSEQNFNISVGIMSGSTVELSYFEEAFQNIVWFDNVSLVVTASANSTQSDVNLKINGFSLNDNDWGSCSKDLVGYWETNPITLNFSTDSPDLTFLLDTIISGYHETYSKIGQTTQEGASYKILNNGSISWVFSHNFYMPSYYENFEFIINKSSNWKFISVLDPTFQSVSFERGDVGDDILKINKSNALYPGWWTLMATSPNFLNLSNTKMLKQGEWGQTSFTTGETTSIKTQINYSNEIPLNVETTEVNLTIYFPNGSIWYQESMIPYANGTVISSEMAFTEFNTIGGQYNYTLFWSNGTALGGLESNFLVIHNSSLTLLKPDDAKLDLRTAGFVGDIIPVRILLEDSENNLTISDSNISYNWTDGTHYFIEAALGIYETILYTSDLASRGLYSIFIQSSKVGFFEANLTLEINLGEETNLQILDSDYNIELHANSTIIFNFTDYDGDGIDGATVTVDISNTSLYTINDTGNGGYNIEFSTLYIETIGIHQLDFSFEAPNYEPQYYTYQFQITEQSVNIIFYFNNSQILENSLQQVSFYDEINISAQIISIIDMENISGGIITWRSEYLEKDLNEYVSEWYNTSIIFNPSNFSFGINYVYLDFQHPNYKTKAFGFQLLVNQIEFKVDLVGFEDVVRVAKGGTLSIEIELLDPETSNLIENASVLYNWQYGVGSLNEISPGVYTLTLKLPENLQGNFNFKIIVSKEGTVYKATEFSFLLTIGTPGIPAFLIWLILIAAAAIISVLGILSLRSYIFIPRKREKLSKLLTRTQRYKDLQNIQAIVVIHRLSGIPLYSKSYSILEKQKKELFSGFVQAITTIGEEIVGKQQIDEDSSEIKIVERILELDFKYFNCLICDQGDIRIVLILKEKASERLKEIIGNFSMGLTLQLSQQIENWDGSLDMFESLIPPILENYIELFYKEPFALNNPQYIAQMKKILEITSMETRLLNVIYSMVKSKNNFYLDHLLDTIHEQNKDKVIDAIENLIDKKLIITAKK